MMKTEEEIRQAINDLMPNTVTGSHNDQMQTKLLIDLLMWVLGKPSIAGPNLDRLREVRTAQNKAKTN